MAGIKQHSLIVVVVVLIALGLLAVVVQVQGQQSLKECPDIKPLEHVEPKSLLGTWYSMRVGPPDQDYGEGTVWDCVSETWWADRETLPGIINTVYHHRFNGQSEDMTGTINTTATKPGAEYMWDYVLMGMHIPTTVVATDGGRTWSLGVSCLESAPGNITAMWGIASRTRTIDPKLEQMLVKEIWKRTGGQVGSDDLYAIGQENCV